MSGSCWDYRKSQLGKHRKHYGWWSSPFSENLGILVSKLHVLVHSESDTVSKVDNALLWRIANMPHIAITLQYYRQQSTAENTTENSDVMSQEMTMLVALVVTGNWHGFKTRLSMTTTTSTTHRNYQVSTQHPTVSSSSSSAAGAAAAADILCILVTRPNF